jgi:hypothetical protein
MSPWLCDRRLRHYFGSKNLLGLHVLNFVTLCKATLSKKLAFRVSCWEAIFPPRTCSVLDDFYVVQIAMRLGIAELLRWLHGKSK